MHSLKTKFASVVKAGVPVLLMAGLLVSCSKERFNSGADQQSTVITDKGTQKKLIHQAEKMPAVGIYNKTMDKVIIFSVNENGEKSFNFANPNSGGINFATSNGGQWVAYPDEPGGLIIITEPGAGLGSGGGSVVVGNTALDISFAMCFSVDEQAIGIDLFDTGIDEVAGVIGFAGDFEALANADLESEELNPFDYFQGLAYYLVYADDLANQSYEVLNWIEDLEQDVEELEGFGFSYVVHFVNDGGIYLSQDGELTVDGGSIGFNGNYFGINGLGFFGEEGDEPTFEENIPGFGTMGCE